MKPKIKHGPYGDRCRLFIVELPGKTRYESPNLELCKGPGDRWAVTNILVPESAGRRQRYGTRLYETAARFACRAGHGLVSDYRRSTAAEMFWRKQVDKGRAVCLSTAKKGALYDPHSRRVVDANHWGCFVYGLTCPAPRSLAGIRR